MALEKMARQQEFILWANRIMLDIGMYGIRFSYILLRIHIFVHFSRFAACETLNKASAIRNTLYTALTALLALSFCASRRAALIAAFHFEPCVYPWSNLIFLILSLIEYIKQPPKYGKRIIYILTILVTNIIISLDN